MHCGPESGSLPSPGRGHAEHKRGVDGHVHIVSGCSGIRIGRRLLSQPAVLLWLALVIYGVGFVGCEGGPASEWRSAIDDRLRH